MVRSYGHCRGTEETDLEHYNSLNLCDCNLLISGFELKVVDVDENMHAPVFSDHAVLTGSVREDSERGTVVLTAAATDADAAGRDSRLAYYVVAGSGMAHFSVDDAGISDIDIFTLVLVTLAFTR